jgi:hypothetical protein
MFQKETTQTNLFKKNPSKSDEKLALHAQIKYEIALRP